MLSNNARPPLLDRLVHHYDELVSYVCRATGRFHSDHRQVRDSAREAVHDICLQLLGNNDAAEEIKVPLAFLRTLSKRRAIDNLRRDVAWARFAARAEDHPELNELAAGASDEPEHRLLAKQRLALLAQAIESLPPRCREVFVLHKIHEWPQAEVADYLGISIKTVEKHMRIAVACCRFALGDLLPQPGARGRA
ncbi:RNA polymerase sigma factor [Herbaspirillum lusitanum]|jgi:RNA polymerase sigma-70 factor (ECF subfamily)|uniref:RNA polymerase sigma factor n=1 Tax=Herbaspirillum lusitanum TaxID=213312 RepID=A0ABW9A5E2_9BURK